MICIVNVVIFSLATFYLADIHTGDLKDCADGDEVELRGIEGMDRWKAEMEM